MSLVSLDCRRPSALARVGLEIGTSTEGGSGDSTPSAQTSPEAGTTRSNSRAEVSLGLNSPADIDDSPASTPDSVSRQWLHSKYKCVRGYQIKSGERRWEFRLTVKGTTYRKSRFTSELEAKQARDWCLRELKQRPIIEENEELNPPQLPIFPLGPLSLPSSGTFPVVFPPVSEPPHSTMPGTSAVTTSNFSSPFSTSTSIVPAPHVSSPAEERDSTYVSSSLRGISGRRHQSGISWGFRLFFRERKYKKSGFKSEEAAAMARDQLLIKMMGYEAAIPRLSLPAHWKEMGLHGKAALDGPHRLTSALLNMDGPKPLLPPFLPNPAMPPGVSPFPGGPASFFGPSPLRAGGPPPLMAPIPHSGFPMPSPLESLQFGPPQMPKQAFSQGLGVPLPFGVGNSSQGLSAMQATAAHSLPQLCTEGVSTVWRQLRATTTAVSSAPADSEPQASSVHPPGFLPPHVFMGHPLPSIALGGADNANANGHSPSVAPTLSPLTNPGQSAPQATHLPSPATPYDFPMTTGHAAPLQNLFFNNHAMAPVSTSMSQGVTSTPLQHGFGRREGQGPPSPFDHPAFLKPHIPPFSSAAAGFPFSTAITGMGLDRSLSGMDHQVDPVSREPQLQGNGLWGAGERSSSEGQNVIQPAKAEPGRFFTPQGGPQGGLQGGAHGGPQQVVFIPLPPNSRFPPGLPVPGNLQQFISQPLSSQEISTGLSHSGVPPRRITMFPPTNALPEHSAPDSSSSQKVKWVPLSDQASTAILHPFSSTRRWASAGSGQLGPGHPSDDDAAIF